MSDSIDRDSWVGFDLGGTKMLAQVYDGDLRGLGRERRKTKAAAGTDSGLERIGETIEAALTAAAVDKQRLAGIGIGCPGPVDMDRGVLLNPPNLGWRDVAIGERLARQFGCPVAVLNDVDAGVYAEYRFGAAKGAKCVVGVFPGTGIGGGCVYRGEILRGSVSSCMEIGHIQVMPEGPLCGCGRRGCLEAVASRLSIASQAARAAYRGEAPHLYEAAETDISEIVREAARHIGRAVAGVIHILGPDLIVLGGGLVEAMPDLFVDHVGKTARKRVMAAFRDTFQVTMSKLKDDAVAQGAAAWAQHVADATKAKRAAKASS
jgi:glucokinase